MADLDPEFIAKLRTIVENHSVALYNMNNIYTSRAYKVGVNARGLMREPVKYGKKIPNLALRHPTKLVKYVTGSKRIVSSEEKDNFDKSYLEWIKKNAHNEDYYSAQTEESKKFAKRPLISILTPVFNPPNDVLEELILSVSNQTYDNWELWLGEFAGNSENQALLKSYSKKDPRIKFKVFKENGGISKNSDAIFKHTKGEFIALLDHDDLLTRDALFENVKLINSGTYDLIYSDKDKISETGVRFDPIFKPDWSPEMMLSANYLTHLNVIRRSKIVEVGGWDSSTDGAQDWDLFLRVADKSTPKKIGHISKVLYHWRTLVTSTALNMSAKPYALEAQCRTVDNHLQRIGAVQGKSYRDQESRMFVEWGVLEQAKPTIIVISRQRDRLTEFVNCVRRHQMEDFKFILVHEDLDVRGVDTSMFTYVDGYKPGHLYSALNQIIDGLDGQVVFMRDTIKVDKGFNEILSQLSGWLQIKGVFAVAPKITDEHGLVTGTGRVRGLASAFGDLFYKTPYVSGVFGSYDWTRNFSALTGKFFMTSSANIKLAGGVAVGVGDMEALDSLFVGAHDAGLRSVYDPLYSIVDLAPFKLELPPSDVMKSLLKKKFESGKDPYYNENLSNLDTSGMLRSGAEGVAKDVALDI